jgi:hypothetical protein
LEARQVLTVYPASSSELAVLWLMQSPGARAWPSVAFFCAR